MEPTDAALLRKVSRQLRLLNIAVSCFGVLILIGFVVAGILCFKAYTFVHNESVKIDSLQKQASQTLNIKQQLCNDSSISSLVKAQSGYCD